MATSKKPSEVVTPAEDSVVDQVVTPPDETVPGGAYIVNGVVVDANGNPREGWTVDKKTGRAVPPVMQSEE